MPHICFVTPTIYPTLFGDKKIPFAGGAEVQQSFVARGLQKAGFPVSVVTGDFGQPDECNLDGIRVLKITERGARIPVIRHYHPRLTAIWNAMRRADADIYLQRCAGANTFLVGLYARLKGRRFVYAAASMGDLVLPQTRTLFQKTHTGLQEYLCYRIGLRLADVIVSQNAAQDSACRQYHGRGTVTVPSCYAVPLDARSDPTGAVLWVSALRRWKRVELLFALARRTPTVNFRIVGGPSADRDALEYFAKIREQAAAIPNVEFLGFVPYQDADRLFDRASLFVNTSDDTEGFPNTFLQAWARGVPTVSFYDCGARDRQGPIGRLARNLEEMAAMVRELIANPDLLRSEGERCKKYFADNHSVEATIDRYKDLITSMSVKSREDGVR